MKLSVLSESVHITDPDALDKMAELEGQRWLKTQQQNPESHYSFPAYLNAWKEIEAEGIQGEDVSWAFRELLHGGDGAIYGDGGYSRYTVTNHGEIVLQGWSTHADKIAKAKQLGFSVTDTSFF
jgi:hypothetical protein